MIEEYFTINDLRKRVCFYFNSLIQTYNGVFRIIENTMKLNYEFGNERQQVIIEIVN